MDDSRHKDATSSSTCFSHFCSSALRAKTLKSSSSANNSSDGLIRRLGVFDLILLGVGASIGAGIFVVTGTVARDAGPGVTISFILAGASCVLNALCYAELAIARSLASYVATIFELIPALKGNIPPWVGHGGQEFFGGTLSINILAPILLAVLTVILCLGVGESSAVNSFMTAAKVVIVIFVIIVGSFKVDVDNWSPFAPNGVKHIFTGATVVFFAYVGFDAVANSAEESKRPQRDLPIGILGSLLVCVVLYVGVCLVITGMVPYNLLGEDAPLSEAFTSKGLKYVSILISIGAVAGLTTTLLVGLYVQLVFMSNFYVFVISLLSNMFPVYMMECFSEQSRLYLGLGRDGLLPSIFAKVHPTGYSVVAACVVTLRWKNNTGNRVSSKCISTWCEGVLCIFLVACCGFAAGVLYRFGTHFIFMIVAVVIAIMACAALCFRQAYSDPPGFSCPWVPIVPSVCIFFNIFLFAQLHYEAWIRFIILSIVSVGIYAFYGQYHANPRSDETIIYHMAPEEDRH
ncbi:hypothetical protein Gogos_010500 [Gossypium gossypioides]|uniref:Cationic amino acid transporter C-terminal domain-containing protein n=1 Tax=Gossypium gossypioides TaxID=34282 RepID=A0A7J9BLF8_GOSGO|nr:hypothetical protein [Gossypium gossypioides]